MLQFKQSDIEATLIVTLTEKVTIGVPYYLFVFTHVLTKDVVKFIKSIDEDESAYTNRYNQFTINPSVIFAGQQPGEWHYKVYEKDSETDLTANGNILEEGKFILDRAI